MYACIRIPITLSVKGPSTLKPMTACITQEMKGSRYGENLMRGLRKLTIASLPLILLWLEGFITIFPVFFPGKLSQGVGFLQNSVYLGSSGYSLFKIHTFFSSMMNNVADRGRPCLPFGQLRHLNSQTASKCLHTCDTCVYHNWT